VPASAKNRATDATTRAGLGRRRHVHAVVPSDTFALGNAGRLDIISIPCSWPKAADTNRLYASQLNACGALYGLSTRPASRTWRADLPDASRRPVNASVIKATHGRRLPRHSERLRGQPGLLPPPSKSRGATRADECFARNAIAQRRPPRQSLLPHRPAWAAPSQRRRGASRLPVPICLVFTRPAY
jgi:hypothetical protein